MEGTSCAKSVNCLNWLRFSSSPEIRRSERADNFVYTHTLISTIDAFYKHDTIVNDGLHHARR